MDSSTSTEHCMLGQSVRYQQYADLRQDWREASISLDTGMAPKGTGSLNNDDPV